MFALFPLCVVGCVLRCVCAGGSVPFGRECGDPMAPRGTGWCGVEGSRSNLTRLECCAWPRKLGAWLVALRRRLRLPQATWRVLNRSSPATATSSLPGSVSAHLTTGDVNVTYDIIISSFSTNDRSRLSTLQRTGACLRG